MGKKRGKVLEVVCFGCFLVVVFFFAAFCFKCLLWLFFLWFWLFGRVFRGCFDSLKGIQVCLQHGIWKIQKSSKRINSDALKREPSETHPTKTGKFAKSSSKVPMGRGFLLFLQGGF